MSHQSQASPRNTLPNKTSMWLWFRHQIRFKSSILIRVPWTRKTAQRSKRTSTWVNTTIATLMMGRLCHNNNCWWNRAKTSSDPFLRGSQCRRGKISTHSWTTSYWTTCGNSLTRLRLIPPAITTEQGSTLSRKRVSQISNRKMANPSSITSSTWAQTSI